MGSAKTPHFAVICKGTTQMKLKNLLVAAALTTPSFAYAVSCGLIAGGGTSYDLTAGGSATVNTAILTTTDQQPTGSGVIDSFVRISSANDACVQGYNTDARPLQFDENSSPTFTRDLLLSAVPVVTIGGVAYREFLLDINQQAANPLLSLNDVEIYVHNTAGISGYTGGSFGSLTPVWDLDGAGNAVVELNYNLNSGSGSGDLFLYVPDSKFDKTKTYVTLFSSFGIANVNNDGYEEWAVRLPTGTRVSEPGMLALFGVALLALGYRRRRSSAV
jgi:PEP-CTERM motif-containing protein